MTESEKIKTPLDLDGLEKLMEKATKGPDNQMSITEEIRRKIEFGRILSEQAPALLAEVKRLRKIEHAARLEHDMEETPHGLTFGPGCSLCEALAQPEEPKT